MPWICSQLPPRCPCVAASGRAEVVPSSSQQFPPSADFGREESEEKKKKKAPLRVEGLGELQRQALERNRADLPTEFQASEEYIHEAWERTAPEDLDLGSVRDLAREAGRDLCQRLHRELRISQMDGNASCSHSMSLFMMWDLVEASLADPVFRAITREARFSTEAAPEPPLRFTVTLCRTAQHNNFGFSCKDVFVDEGGVLLITAVQINSLIYQWNERCTWKKVPSRRILLYAAILSVNGFSGNCFEMRRELSTSASAVLSVCNPPSLSTVATLMELCTLSASPVPRSAAFWLPSLPRVGDGVRLVNV